MISGDTGGITTDCSPTDPACAFDVPSLPDQIEAAGKTWKGYMESMPAPCSLSGTTLYDIGHDPFVYLLPIKNNTSRCNSHVVNLDQLDVDLAAGMVPNFVFITRNACHDMHNCGVSDWDQWLSGYLPRILNAPAYQQDGVLFLLWDEGTTDANTIPFVLISPLGRRGFVSNAFENDVQQLGLRAVRPEPVAKGGQLALAPDEQFAIEPAHGLTVGEHEPRPVVRRYRPGVNS